MQTMFIPYCMVCVWCMEPLGYSAMGLPFKVDSEPRESEFITPERHWSDPSTAQVGFEPAPLLTLSNEWAQIPLCHKGASQCAYGIADGVSFHVALCSSKTPLCHFFPQFLNIFAQILSSSLFFIKVTKAGLLILSTFWHTKFMEMITSQSELKPASLSPTEYSAFFHALRGHLQVAPMEVFLS